MSRAEIQAAVADLLSITLARPIRQNDDVAREAEPAWDSLKHVELMLMLEERFGLQFSEEEMATLCSSGEIVRAIERKNAA